MSCERYVLYVPFGFYGLCTKLSGLTKEQVIDITLARMKDGIFPDDKLLDFIIENQSLRGSANQ